MRFLFDSRLAAISLVAAFLLPVPVLAGSQLLKEVPATTFNPRSEPADVDLLAGAAQVASQQQGWVWDGNSGKQMYNISKREGSRILQLTLQVDASGYRLRHLQSQGFDLKQADAERKTAKEPEDVCRFNLRCLSGVPAKLKQAEGGKVDVIDEAYYGWVTPLARQLQLAGNAALAQTWADVYAANLLRSDGELLTFPILDKAAQVAAPSLGWQLLPPAQPGTVRLTRSEGGRSATVQLAQRGQGFRLSYIESAGLGWSRRVRQLDDIVLQSSCFGTCQRQLAELKQAYQEDGRLYEQRIDDTYYQWVNALRDAIAAEADRVQP